MEEKQEDLGERNVTLTAKRRLAILSRYVKCRKSSGRIALRSSSSRAAYTSRYFGTTSLYIAVDQIVRNTGICRWFVKVYIRKHLSSLMKLKRCVRWQLYQEGRKEAVQTVQSAMMNDGQRRLASRSGGIACMSAARSFSFAPSCARIGFSDENTPSANLNQHLITEKRKKSDFRSDIPQARPGLQPRLVKNDAMSWPKLFPRNHLPAGSMNCFHQDNDNTVRPNLSRRCKPLQFVQGKPQICLFFYWIHPTPIMPSKVALLPLVFRPLYTISLPN